MFSTFCLDAKGGAKKSRQARTAPRVLPPTHSNSHYRFYHSRTSLQEAGFTILKTTFSKLHVFPSSVTYSRRYIPLRFS
jgi:hypothetical protein